MNPIPVAAAALLLFGLTQPGYAVSSNPRTNTVHIVCSSGHDLCSLVVKNKDGRAISDMCADKRGMSTTTTRPSAG